MNLCHGCNQNASPIPGSLCQQCGGWYFQLSPEQQRELLINEEVLYSATINAKKMIQKGSTLQRKEDELELFRIADLP
jgi:hypothetical protein